MSFESRLQMILLREKALTAEAARFPPLPADLNKSFLGERYAFMYNLPRHPAGCHQASQSRGDARGDAPIGRAENESQAVHK